MVLNLYKLFNYNKVKFTAVSDPDLWFIVNY